MVNLLVYLVQLLRVGGPVEVTISGLGNAAQGLVVNLNGDIDILDTARHGHRVRSHLVAAHTHRIDADAEALGNLGCRHRRDVATVVGTVGQQDDHAALGLRVLQATDAVGQSHADGRTILYQSTLCNVSTHVLQQVEQRGVVGGHGALRKSLTGKDAQTDVVVGTP